MLQRFILTPFYFILNYEIRLSITNNYYIEYTNLIIAFKDISVTTDYNTIFFNFLWSETK